MELRATTIVGGYDLEKIEASTVESLTKSGIVTAADEIDVSSVVTTVSKDPLVRGTDIIAFYDRLGAILVKKKILSQQEITVAQNVASKSGGMKIGGLNPVVLAASYLDLLVKKQIISLSEAQNILDTSKVK